LTSEGGGEGGGGIYQDYYSLPKKESQKEERGAAYHQQSPIPLPAQGRGEEIKKKVKVYFDREPIYMKVRKRKIRP